MTIALRRTASRNGRSATVAFSLSLAVHCAAAAAFFFFAGTTSVPPDEPLELEVFLTSPAPAPSAAPAAPARAIVTPPAPVRPIVTTAPAEFEAVAIEPDVPREPTDHVPLIESPADATGDANTAPALVETSEADDVFDEAVAATDANAQRGFVELHVLDWLAQHRRYPRAAARAHLEGVVHVSFKLVPDGRIIEGRLETSSGTRLLDGAALELLRRASPIPGLAQFAMTRPIELRLPIQYRLRRATKA